MYISLVVSVIILAILSVDLPFFIVFNREALVEVNNIKLFTIEGRRSTEFEILTIYKDTFGNTFWSGAPIGQKEWIEDIGIIDSVRICKVKYLPVTRLVVEVTEDNKVVYNNFKDILTIILVGFFIAIVFILIDVKDSILGKKNL